MLNRSNGGADRAGVSRARGSGTITIAFHEHVGTVLAQRAAQARLDFKRDFIDRMTDLGLTLDDLKPEKPKKERKKRDLPVKFRDPDNTDNSWSGRGRAPASGEVDEGRAINDFLIEAL